MLYFTDHYSLPSRDELYFTSYVPTQIVTILALPGLLFISFLLFISASLFLYLFPLLYILFIPFIWYPFAARKSSRPFSDTDISSIVSRAETKLGMSGKIRMYDNEKKSNFLTSARTPWMCGIMLSEHTARMIKEKPVEGEIVLAYEIALLKRDHLWLSFLRNLAATLYSILTEGTMLFLFIEPLYPILSQAPLWIIAVSLCYPLGIGIFVWYRRKASAENEVESIYGMNPHLALFQVFSRTTMSDAGRMHYLHEIESNIESRKSRTAFVSLGVVLIVSLVISAVIYILFLSVSMPLEFALFGALALGGISFSFGVLYFESKGTMNLHRPEFRTEKLPHSIDEVSRSVERLISMKTGISDCTIYHYTSDPDLDYEDELSGFTEVHIGKERFMILREKWDELGDPELISSYLVGEYVARKAGIGLSTYPAVLIGFLILLVFGTAYLVIIHMSRLLTFFLWIGFCIVFAVVSLLSINTESTRKRIKALRALAQKDANYLQALKKLANSYTEHEYVRKEAKWTLMRIASKTK